MSGVLASRLPAVLRYELQCLQQAAASSLSSWAAGSWPRYSPAAQVQRRQYSADAPEPMIIPAQRNQQQQQQQQTAAVPAQRQEMAVQLPDSNQGPWERVIDKTSGQPYWWNAKTGITTPVGASKPDAWVAVVDQRTQAEYYWNKQSGETTAVGEPLPGPEGRVATAAADAAWQQPQQFSHASTASVLGNSLAVGFGVGLVFAIIRMVF